VNVRSNDQTSMMSGRDRKRKVFMCTACCNVPHITKNNRKRKNSSRKTEIDLGKPKKANDQTGEQTNTHCTA
jgi:hypothetical protein